MPTNRPRSPAKFLFGLAVPKCSFKGRALVPVGSVSRVESHESPLASGGQTARVNR